MTGETLVVRLRPSIHERAVAVWRRIRGPGAAAPVGCVFERGLATAGYHQQTRGVRGVSCVA
jgi:hypothetical protein